MDVDFFPSPKPFFERHLRSFPGHIVFWILNLDGELLLIFRFYREKWYEVCDNLRFNVTHLGMMQSEPIRSFGRSPDAVLRGYARQFDMSRSQEEHVRILARFLLFHLSGSILHLLLFCLKSAERFADEDCPWQPARKPAQRSAVHVPLHRPRLECRSHLRANHLSAARYPQVSIGLLCLIFVLEITAWSVKIIHFLSLTFRRDDAEAQVGSLKKTPFVCLKSVLERSKKLLVSLFYLLAELPGVTRE